MKNGVIDLEGATCASCAYTIEHLARKIDGIDEIRVDTRNAEIHIRSNGEKRLLEKIVEIVRKIGYDAKIRSW